MELSELSKLSAWVRGHSIILIIRIIRIILIIILISYFLFLSSLSSVSSRSPRSSASVQGGLISGGSESAYSRAGGQDVGS